MLTKTHPRSGQDATAVLVAREAILLWPRDREGTAWTSEPWPVFLIVVGDRPVGARSSAKPLFDMLNRHRTEEPVVVGARSRWSVLDRRNALLQLSVHGAVPMRFAARIVFPARKVLGILDTLTRGTTIGITTSSRAARLSGSRIDVRQALGEMVLLGQPDPGDLRPQEGPDPASSYRV